MPNVHDTERALQREVTQRVESGLPGVEVLALELASPERFTVYVDHPAGVDHRLCARVTEVLRPYLDRYAVEVSSPGVERPLRKPAHFRSVVGRTVALRTKEPVEGRRKIRGAVADAGERTIKVGVDGAELDIPYDAIVRANLIDEG